MLAFETSETAGLASAVAHERLHTYGPNLPPESVPRSGLSILLDQFTSLPVALLGVAAGISLCTGGLADAVVIAGVVAINATLGYVTESRTEQTMHSLKSLVRPSALLQRDGEVVTVRSEDIVPGDVLVLRPGSYIAADARLLQAQRLSVDESALTGSAGALGAYGYGLARYGAGAQANTLAFASLTSAQLLHALSSRSQTHSLFSGPSLPRNPLLLLAVGGSLGLQVLGFAVPGAESPWPDAADAAGWAGD